jgi:phosphoglycerate-specific signal transduction histidine kinase
MANDTRWSSHLRLHEHILNNIENINQALDKIQRSNLTFSKTDRENLSSVVEVMAYFAQATDILQNEKKPTSSHLIPVIDSLENAPNSVERSQPAINALCEWMLISLYHRFSYLINSDIYQVQSINQIVIYRS